MPTLPIWLAAHAVLVGIIATVLLFVDSETGYGLLNLAGPFALGLAQATVLYRRLPLWATLLWPFATALGFKLSMVLVWFIFFALGGCFGLCQAGLLAAGRVRGWFLWPIISGASWVVGLVALMLLEKARVTFSDSDRPSPDFALLIMLLPYAFGTGMALHFWMGRPPPPTT
jgi:hypothetical protein